MTIRSATYIGTVALLSQLLLAHGCGSNNPSTIAAAGTSGTAGAAAGTPAGGTTGAAGAVAGTPSAARLVRQVRRTPRRPVAQAAQPARRTLRRPVALPPLRRPPAAAAARVPLLGPSILYARPCSRLRVPFPPRLAFARRPIPSFATRPAGPRASASSRKPARAEPTRSSQVARSPRVSTTLVTRYRQSSIRLVLLLCRKPANPARSPTCVLCNVNGGYNDSSGAAKTGYCVCPTTSAGRRASGAAPARRPGHARLARDAEKEQFQTSTRSQEFDPAPSDGEAAQWPNVSQASHKLVAWRPRGSFSALSGCLRGQ